MVYSYYLPMIKMSSKELRDKIISGERDFSNINLEYGTRLIPERLVEKYGTTGVDRELQDAINRSYSEKLPYNFSGSNLAGLVTNADMPWVQIKNADLTGADISNSSFYCADLSGSKMVGVKFRKSVLSRAKFEGSSLRHACFSETSLDDADFTGADLSYAELKNIHNGVNNGYETIMSGISFKGAQLVRANLSGHGMKNCVLEKANLNGADLSRCQLDDIDFSTADITCADLSNSKISGAKGLIHNHTFPYSDIGKQYFHSSLGNNPKLCDYPYDPENGLSLTTEQGAVYFLGRAGFILDDAEKKSFAEACDRMRRLFDENRLHHERFSSPLLSLRDCFEALREFYLKDTC